MNEEPRKYKKSWSPSVCLRKGNFPEIRMKIEVHIKRHSRSCKCHARYRHEVQSKKFQQSLAARNETRYRSEFLRVTFTADPLKNSLILPTSSSELLQLSETF
jgi:hypothetical protein